MAIEKSFSDDLGRDVAVKTITVDGREIAVPMVALDEAIVAGGGGGSDREFVVTTYRVRTAFTGAGLGDIVTCTQVIDATGTPATVATLWRNQSTAADLASAPNAAHIEIIGAQALTDAQLRAAALPLPTGAATAEAQAAQLTELQAINADIGAPADAAAPADGAGSYGVIAALKRGLLNWAALLARLSDLMNVRTYNYAAATRTAVGAASTREALPVPSLNATREIGIISNTRCFVRWGDSAVSVTATDAAVHVVEANANYFHLRVPAGATHYAVIRDTADGFVRILPVL